MIPNAASDPHDGADLASAATVEAAVAYPPALKWR